MISHTLPLRELRACCPPNVVILPTAQPRQVQQPCNKAGREARRDLRDAQRTKFPHKSPGQRKAEKRAAVLVQVRQTPAVMLAEAILTELDEDIRLRVIGRLAERVLSEPGRQAFEVASTTMLNFGQQWDLLNALERAREELS